MSIDPVITWRNMPHSEAVDAIVRERFAAIARLEPRLIRGRVVFDAPHKRRVSGRGFDVRIHLELPGPDIDVARSVRQGEAADDVLRAVNAAFSALERRLKERRREKGGKEVKHHPPVLHGEVVELEPELGYGWLRADDGREVYFERDSLVHGQWERIALGDRLRFREMEGDKGPFAADVSVID